MDAMEPGYTPGNLRVLQARYGLNNTDVARLIDDRPRNVTAWRADLDNPEHRDMPARKWRALLNAIKPA